MGVFYQVLQFLVSISILVIFHEAGHFFFAKLFKTRVEKFYLFFNPWFSIFKFKRGETEYGLGWLPLGGYVKISGMIDESLDKTQMNQEPQPYEFRSKPAWQRLLIMVGGVSVNILLAMAIYAMVLFVWGERYLPVKNAVYGIYCDSLAIDSGLQNGDKIVALDGENIENFNTILTEVLLNDIKTITVERDTQQITIDLSPSLVKEIIRKESFFIEPAFPFSVGEFAPESPAKDGGMQLGDTIIAFNGTPTQLFAEYIPLFQQYKNQKITLTVKRSGDTLDIPVTISKAGKIGVAVASDSIFQFERLHYGFFESIPAGISKGYKTVVDYLKQLKLIFSPETEAYKSLGGFISIGKIFNPYWDWLSFWTMTAFLSIILGVLNLLPIPALDGGHVTFLIYEMVTGRKPSDKFLEYAQIAGMVILLALVLYANGNDIVRYVLK